jgi:hypothetical protein
MDDDEDIAAAIACIRGWLKLASKAGGLILVAFCG